MNEIIFIKTGYPLPCVSENELVNAALVLTSRPVAVARSRGRGRGCGRGRGGARETDWWKKKKDEGPK